MEEKIDLYLKPTMLRGWVLIRQTKKCLVIRYRQDCQLLLFEQLFDKYLKSEKSELPWDEWLFDFCFKQIKEAKK